ncbi:pyrroloquinoline quinone biosynthesis protein PqqE [Streptomyces thermodiastaticus]|jgi:pyrroloquinoline quinone biosynthesis protein E|uniref:pyrroloquinoline quinone biosynthesis protein PqqE n=1 Tax=Streptomyces thermodiastaticus TaxID=44061 RepID=UPI001677278D|nr:pyrroloquinoline quinone biosynthesis protein PqqE [Streptomyces thermodiastaticus]MCE7549565.1 pyrroloquinoline quinone biosynthesis protein PqqE [Streptomyces thermodiastaticus]GHF57184.1 coenzyme PQQ synthesis protein E [Streptomyces thermodiastaticus]
MTAPSAFSPPPPWALLAELTHACPLHCPYCSNPLDLARRSRELTTEEWEDVLRQAGELGVVHTHLSGGEPLLRPDLERIVAAAEDAGIYTQLVTSGTGLDEARLAALTAAGLRSVQLSVQHADPRAGDRIAGRAGSFAAKEHAARLVRRAGLPLGLNVVLHRGNLDAVDALLDLAVAWGADRVELANTQYYGWGLLNRAALMPTRDQLARARQTVERRREQLAGRTDLVWVVPDYFDGVAKPCMGGWGAVSLTVAPDGTVLPCPAAASIPGLDPPGVRDHPLAWIWRHSPAFNRFRGTDWMTGPCRGCPRREEDFGGCRCQAFALTGDAARTDPACALSPDHHLVREQTEADRAVAPPYVYRRPGAAPLPAPARAAVTEDA